jgi:hypothetical protein
MNWEAKSAKWKIRVSLPFCFFHSLQRLLRSL